MRMRMRMMTRSIRRIETIGKCLCSKDFKEFVVDDDGWWCNQCEENSTSPKVKNESIGSKMYGCRKCDYDICEGCYKSETTEDMVTEDMTTKELELVNMVLEQSKKLGDKYDSALIKEITELATSKKRHIEKVKDNGVKKLKLSNLKEYRKLISKKANSNEIIYFKGLEKEQQTTILSKLETVTKSMNIDIPYRFSYIRV